LAKPFLLPFLFSLIYKRFISQYVEVWINPLYAPEQSHCLCAQTGLCKEEAPAPRRPQ